jgi:hypothetical protein
VGSGEVCSCPPTAQRVCCRSSRCCFERSPAPAGGRHGTGVLADAWLFRAGIPVDLLCAAVLQPDSYEFADPKDIIPELKKDFWDGLASAKWSERKVCACWLTLRGQPAQHTAAQLQAGIRGCGPRLRGGL